MRIKTRQLLRKLKPYTDDAFGRTHVHHQSILTKEAKRRSRLRWAIMRACDNVEDFFPYGYRVTKYNWMDPRRTLTPSVNRVPKFVFKPNFRRKLYHLVEVKPGVLKVCHLHQKPKSKGSWMYIDTIYEHIRFKDYGWFKVSSWPADDCSQACQCQTCRTHSICLLQVAKQHGFKIPNGHMVQVKDRELNEFSYLPF